MLHLNSRHNELKWLQQFVHLPQNCYLRQNSYKYKTYICEGRRQRSLHDNLSYHNTEILIYWTEDFARTTMQTKTKAPSRPLAISRVNQNLPATNNSKLYLELMFRFAFVTTTDTKRNKTKHVHKYRYLILLCCTCRYVISLCIPMRTREFKIYMLMCDLVLDYRRKCNCLQMIVSH